MKDTYKKTVTFIAANWHADIVEQALAGFTAAVGAAYDVQVVRVPGAFEIPLAAKRAIAGGADAVIGCAFVVDGGIYRHDFVAATVVDALMRVQLDADVPVFSVVLTPHNYQETAEHNAFFKAHFVKKGAEAAAALQAAVAA
ncbi:MAG: 6,7-dimethyl-8-ribityllumazine synthase [Paracoccaceae bacterium]